MKIITVIAVGENRALVFATRAPDLARREAKARFPEAATSLVWCSVPPEGVSARALADRIASRLGGVDGFGLVVANPTAARRAAIVESIVIPTFERCCARLRRLARKGRRAMVQRSQRTAAQGGGP